MTTYTIPTKFTAIDGTGAVIKGMQRNIHSMVNSANVGLARQERLFRRLTPSLGNATQQLLNYASAGAVLAGVGYSGKAIMDYETSIASLSAVTGVSGKQLDGFKNEIVGLATSSKKSAIEVAGSFETIGSMMSQYLTDPKALRQIADAGITLSKASRQELVPTLQNLTSIMNQFDLSADKATDTVNRLTAGEIVGSLRTSQVAEALQEFGAGAYSANVSLAESVSLVEALAKQMKVDKIGVGARNILTVLDSAKGLDKKARRDLKRSGVDLGFLMDKTKSLSARLHELSKISGNATRITSVFGKENKTAAQVIFNQLGTYDAYLAKIKVTNEAQSQATVNSATFAQSVEHLKNTWINYIATSDKAATGLETLKNGVHFVTENLDGIVTVGVNVIKFFALWKATMIATKIVTTSLSIATGIQAGVTGYATYAMEANVIATRAAAIAQGVMSAATAVATGNFAALNAMMAANLIGLIVVGLAALATGLYFASKREDELTRAYQAQIDLNIAKEFEKETDSVKKLTWQYWSLGMGIRDATSASIKYKISQIDFKRQAVESRIQKTKAELEKEKNKLYFADLFTGAMGGEQANTGRRADLSAQLAEQQNTALQLATDRAGIAQYAQGEIGKGIISKEDLGGTFNRPKQTGGKGEGGDNSWQKQMQTQNENKSFSMIDYGKMKEAFAAALKDMKAPNVNITQSAGGPAGTKITSPSSY